MNEFYTNEIPDSMDEVTKEIAHLVDVITSIDLQCSRINSGIETPNSPSWHPRALAKKAHASRRLRLLREAKSAANAEAAAAAAILAKEAKAKLHQQWLLQVEQARKRKDAKFKDRFQALHDWAWDAFPERHEEIAMIVRRADEAIR